MKSDARLRRAEALSRSASVETAVHVAVLVVVLVPLLGVVFPGMLILVGLTMLFSSAPDSTIGQWISDREAASFSIVCAIAAIVGVIGIVLAPRSGAARTNPRELVGRDGEKLIALTQRIWQQTRGDTPPPPVRWIPAMDIAAYAAMPKGLPEVQVSAGLWRAAVSGEPIAGAILAHELAHIRYRDPLLLAFLGYIGTAMQAILLVSALFGLTIIAWVLGLETQAVLVQQRDMVGLLGEWARIVGAASVVMILIPLAWLALRRQISFITSLIEIRADVAGAAYTEGLESFTQHFATHKSVARTGGKDLFSALLSIHLTHIPERERLAILTSPQLIVSPKVSFFALSVLLVFLLPINFATPYLWGGIANHLAMQAMTIAFNAALVLMLMVGCSAIPIRISVGRMVALAAASVVITALPRINVEPVSYLAMSWLIGFGGQPADWSSLPQDVAVTLGDLSGKVQAALLNGGAIVAAAFSILALFALVAAAPAAAKFPAWLRAGLALLLVGAGSVMAGFDAFRALDYGVTSRVQSWFTAQEINLSAMLCLPLVLPALTEVTLALLGRLTWLGSSESR